MLEVSDLEVNLLDFVQKSFAFARLVTLNGKEYAVFERTETESESKFRPRLVKLFVLVPRGLIVHDFASDVLVVAPDGETPGPKSTGSALETAAEKTNFEEQGVAWRRVTVPEVGLVYLPAADSAPYQDAAGAAELGQALRET
jgi:hypothetical protein